jgi:hypothetical protein
MTVIAAGATLVIDLGTLGASDVAGSSRCLFTSSEVTGNSTVT